MAVNSDKPDRWKQDIAASVDLYNDWFLQFAPETYRHERIKATKDVEAMLERTRHLRNLTAAELRNHPSMLFALRMATAPPIARDRLVGLAQVKKSLVNCMEVKQCLPARMSAENLERELGSIVKMIARLADRDILGWLTEDRVPTDNEVYRAATIIADRLCGANADPIVRNAQEQRQLAKIKSWLEKRGYRQESGVRLGTMRSGTFAFRMNVPGLKDDGTAVNIPIDTAIMPLQAARGQLPLMIEAKSAGDFTNTNKRRKEEATKVVQLRKQHGTRVRYVLFLCGYFDAGYLGYEASERIDWVWEHRIDDLAKLGL